MIDPDIAQMMQAMQDNGEPPLFKNTTGEQARQRGVDIRARYYPPVLQGGRRIVQSGPSPARPATFPPGVYRPENPTGATIVFFHGGGWIIGDLDSHDGHARRLAATVGAVVVHVEYRLAPENPFPAGYLDCLAAIDWAYDHIDELGGRLDRIAVAGDSAGGNLAASVALHCRDTGRPLAGQLLIYPAVDLAAGLAVAGGTESGGTIPRMTDSSPGRTTGSNGSTSAAISAWQRTPASPRCTPTATPAWHRPSSVSGITTRCWTRTWPTPRCWHAAGVPDRPARIPRPGPRLLRHGRHLRQRRKSRRRTLPRPPHAAHRSRRWHVMTQ